MIENKRLAVAVSGGVDSVVMLHQLMGTNNELTVVHFNHQLRDTANHDELFVQSLATDFGLPFISESLNVNIYCKNNKVSIELGARECRHAFFDKVLSKGFDYIVLAHHADDAIETMLFNLFRGTGLKGMTSIKGLDNDRKIWRPLIETTKEEILKYAEKHNLSWVEDETNHDTVHTRNFLRHDIIPMLETRRAGVKSVLMNEMKRFAEVDDFITKSAEDWLNKFDGFHRLTFLTEHKALQAEIVAVFWEKVNGSRKGFSEARINEVTRWLNNPKPGSKLFFGKEFLTIKHDYVVVRKKKMEHTTNFKNAVTWLKGKEDHLDDHRVQLAKTLSIMFNVDGFEVIDKVKQNAKC